MDNPDEIELVKGLLRCEPESCQTLINNYSARLFGYIRKRVNNHQDAEEILNDVFYLVITKIEQYDPGQGDLETWMFTIAVNRVRDYLRQHYRQQRELTEAGVTSVVSLTDIDNPDLELVSTEPPTRRQTKKSQALNRVLGQLSERDRAVLAWHYNGLTNQEIANYLGLTEGTLRVCLSRAKSRLMNLLRACPEFRDFFGDSVRQQG